MIASLVTKGMGIISDDLGFIENIEFVSKSNEISFKMMSIFSFLLMVNDTVICLSAFARLHFFWVRKFFFTKS